jgi:hypothetical protein
LNANDNNPLSLRKQLAIGITTSEVYPGFVGSCGIVIAYKCERKRDLAITTPGIRNTARFAEVLRQWERSRPDLTIMHSGS